MSNAHNITSPEFLANLIAQSTAATSAGIMQALAPLLAQQQGQQAVLTDALLRMAPKSVPVVRTMEAIFAEYHQEKGQYLRSQKDDVARAKTIFAIELTVDGTTRRLGHVLISEFTAMWATTLREKRKTMITRYGEPPMPATRNREIAILKKLGSFAMRKRYITEHPLWRYSLEPEDNIAEVDLCPTDFLHLLKYIDDPRIFALALGHYDTGMRREELQGLKWANLDVESSRVKLLKTKTKGKKSRSPKLSPRALAAILAMPRVPGSPYVFTNPETGKRWDASSLYRIFKSRIEASGLEDKLGHKIGWHTLRHACVVNLRKAGVPPKVVQAMMGWGSLAMLERYGDVGDDEQSAGYDTLHGTKRKGPRATPSDETEDDDEA